MKLLTLLLIGFSLLFSRANTDILAGKHVLPWEKSIIRGKLSNGLRYSILPNSTPKRRAELMLYIGVGSLDEDEDQRGVAHLIEHMAFNGTRHFRKNKLVSYLESIGMTFGGDLNANTSFDHTTYLLSLPLEGEHLEKCITIMRDWADGIDFDPEEFDKERGVVLEEKRLRNTADYRLFVKSVPLLYTNPRYQQRLTIGLESVLRNIPVQRAKDFYNTWYRPEFMHIIAVGDFNAAKMQNIIVKNFSDLKDKSDRPRISRLMNEHNETRVATLSDKELTGNVVQIIYGLPANGIKTVGQKQAEMVENIALTLFGMKADEQALKPNPEALKIVVSNERIAPNRKLINFVAVHKRGHAADALKELYSLMWSFARYGFSQTNLDLAKKRIRSQIAKAYKKRFKRRSKELADRLLGSILNDSVFVDYDHDLNLTNALLNDIKLKDINDYFKNLINVKDRVVLYKNIDAEGLDLNSTLKLLESAKSLATDTTQAQKLPASILDINLTAKPIVSESYDKTFDIYRYKLANGIVVDFKYSDNQKNTLYLQASSEGGTSILNLKDLIASNFAPAWISQSGLGKYTDTQVRKILGDKQVSIKTSIERFGEDIKASCSSFDAKSMFEMLYAAITKPKLDPRIFANGKTNAKTAISQAQNSPQFQFAKMVIKKYYKNNPRLNPPSKEDIDKLDREQMLAMYKDRFGDMNNFYFAIVGDIKKEEIKKLISTYLANLPTQDRNETFSSEDYDRLHGKQVIEENLNKEYRAEISLEYHAKIPFSLKNKMALDAIAHILNIRLRNAIREDRSGTYNIGIAQEIPDQLRDKAVMTISFKTDPERADTLIDAAKSVIRKLIDKGPTSKELETYIKTTQVGFEQAKTFDTFWISSMIAAHRLNKPLSEILDIEGLLKQITPQLIQQTAAKLFGDDLLITKLMPKTKGEKEKADKKQGGTDERT